MLKNIKYQYYLYSNFHIFKICIIFVVLKNKKHMEIDNKQIKKDVNKLIIDNLNLDFKKDDYIKVTIAYGSLMKTARLSTYVVKVTDIYLKYSRNKYSVCFKGKYAFTTTASAINFGETDIEDIVDVEVLSGFDEACEVEREINNNFKN